MEDYNLLANALDRAALSAQPISQLSKDHTFNLSEAYQIQNLTLQKCLGRGENLAGMKLGFTSKAKMEQMGIEDVIWGALTDRMKIASGDIIDRSKFIHPRAEPEIAFRISNDIHSILTMDNAKNYVDGIAIAIEVIDSRYQNFKFSLEDVVADNCSSSAFVVGDWHSPKIPIENTVITLSVDGKIIAEGNSNAILGNPWEALVAATRLANEYGRVLKAGEVVLAGAATAAFYIEQCQKVEAFAEGLGIVNLSVG